MKPPPSAVRLLALYRRTYYDVLLPDGDTATLRIGEAPPPAVAAWIGADAQAVYLTACNPRSRALPAAENQARLAELRDVLRAAGARWLDGSAAIPGQSWREASLLVAGLPLARLDALARQFEQNASVHVRADAPARLRLHRRAWYGLAQQQTDLETATD